MIQVLQVLVLGSGQKNRDQNGTSGNKNVKKMVYNLVNLDLTHTHKYKHSIMNYDYLSYLLRYAEHFIEI